MAREKKKEILTPEERLQAALVPDWEQPYKVPENWIYFYFTSLIDIEGGTQPPKSQFVDKDREGYIRLVQIRDFASDKYRVFVPDTTKLRHFSEEDILIARYGASLGRICTGMSGAYNVALAKTIFSSSVLNRKYVYWILNSEFFQVPLMRISRTAQAGFNKDDLSKFTIPLPPLPEQQRIVDRIESLFAKLDEAKQKVQDALDSFETRKAAILHKAFTGELTVQWRKENGVGMESWKNLQWGNFIISVEAGKNWKAEGRPPQANEFGVVKVSAVTWGEFDEIESKTCTIEEQWNEKVQIHKGDFLFSRANTLQLVGNCVIVKSISRRLMLSDKILRFKFNNCVIPDYVLNFTRSNSYRQQIEQMASGNQDGMRNVSQKNMKLIQFPIPKLDEQAEIVHILDALFAKEQQAKEAAEAVLEQIDLIKKSILARAFRGELGTNDPNEESSIELLKRSFLETIESEKVKPKQVTKQKKEVVFMRKTIMEALSKGVRLTPEKLKSETQLPIDDFYAQLKELIDHGSVVESRENGESYLEVVNENRQTDN